MNPIKTLAEEGNLRKALVDYICRVLSTCIRHEILNTVGAKVLYYWTTNGEADGGYPVLARAEKGKDFVVHAPITKKRRDARAQFDVRFDDETTVQFLCTADVSKIIKHKSFDHYVGWLRQSAPTAPLKTNRRPKVKPKKKVAKKKVAKPKAKHGKKKRRRVVSFDN